MNYGLTGEKDLSTMPLLKRTSSFCGGEQVYSFQYSIVVVKTGPSKRPVIIILTTFDLMKQLLHREPMHFFLIVLICFCGGGGGLFQYDWLPSPAFKTELFV